MATSVCVSELIKIDQMSIKIESSRNITNVSAIDPKVRLQIATSVCVSDSIKCHLNLKLKKYYKPVSCIYPKVRLQIATSCVCVSDLIQIHQMSIKIESSRNITNVSAIDPINNFLFMKYKHFCHVDTTVAQHHTCCTIQRVEHNVTPYKEWNKCGVGLLVVDT